MKTNRIVSFLPSATELIYEFGNQEQLYGITHECKYPKEAQKKPQVISSVIDSEKLSSVEIDNQICHLLKEGRDIFVLDEKKLEKANPDLIIAQKTCEVCAPYTNLIERAANVLAQKPRVYSMDPHNLNEILDSVIEFGKILERRKKAEEIKNKFEKRISNIKNNVKERKIRVLAIEWIEPFFTAGHWIPQMVEIAGGVNMVSSIGEHSRKMSFEEIENSDPEIIILMPCGFNTKRTIEEYNKILKNNPRWNQLQAVKNKKIFAVDANSFFSKPSIRTITGLEILAKIIHPDLFDDIRVPKNSNFNIIGPTEA